LFTLVWTTGFTRSAEKFTTRHPELRQRFASVLRDLEHDPFQPHLRYHHWGVDHTEKEAGKRRSNSFSRVSL
jgi:hypothetical protein